MLWAAAALAASVLVYPPSGAPTPGSRIVLEALVTEAGAPVLHAALGIQASAGRMAGPVVEVGAGRYRATYVAPGAPTQESLRLTLGGSVAGTARLDVVAAPAPRVLNAPPVDAVVGAGRIELRFPASPPPDARDLVVRASEGRVLEVRAEPEGLVVAVAPGPERPARVVVVGIRDLRAPELPPAWGTARLKARHAATVTAEPGSRVTMRVSGRSYGPFVAGAEGTAEVHFDASPGEAAYDMLVSDDLGNSQKIAGIIPALSRPTLVALDGAAGEMATVDLAGFTPSGAPWAGFGPSCRLAGLETDAPVAVGRGVWRWTATLRPDSPFDQRLDCTLGEAVVGLALPPVPSVPARIELRLYPETLDADFPMAQAQAILVDQRGDRLPAAGLALRADGGTIDARSDDGTIRGEYHAQSAVAAGGDTVRAEWRSPPGRGEAWRLGLWAAAGAQGLELVARAWDREGRPVAGVPVAFAAPGGPVSATTDTVGWARATAPLPPGESWVISARSPAATASCGVARLGVVALPNPEAADLVSVFVLPVRAGKVREVFIDVTPRPLVSGSGEEAVVVVRMLDGAGNLVRDEPVTISASEGDIGEPAGRGDGAVEARYRPPAGSAARTVRITASTGGSTYATDLEILPKPVRGAVGASVGWIDNFGSVSAAIFGASFEPRLPVPGLALRLGLAGYRAEGQVADAATGNTIEVRSDFFPVDVGALFVRRSARLSTQGGVSMALAPYALDVQYGSSGGYAGLALAPPGVLVHGSVAWRLAGAEVFTEARYLLLGAPGGTVSFSGSVGGLSLAAGYRVLY